eukprot:scaffold218191_cov14-Tisochrysis_lutea.AAC.1
MEGLCDLSPTPSSASNEDHSLTGGQPEMRSIRTWGITERTKVKVQRSRHMPTELTMSSQQ